MLVLNIQDSILAMPNAWSSPVSWHSRGCSLSNLKVTWCNFSPFASQYQAHWANFSIFCSMLQQILLPIIAVDLLCMSLARSGCCAAVHNNPLALSSTHRGSANQPVPSE